ncbi:hypothetical protein E0W68_09895 [Flavobacterium salilacus subsp. salilacus]|uniref:hypothetical protein n=1 Tax=Flavobacterium TaxID=237 RepID=UPI001075893D|nr:MULTISPECIES: hypothetical protein [Flavobacterium]KAF2518239.1 hypothetical protein E0W68_09895 [Flavobacterium salilacus subsp. salilacus]MBE1615262.1 hypothetical protein [Flavobacterium sp. SaA2.13]
MKKLLLSVLLGMAALLFFSCSSDNDDATPEARQFGVKPKSLPASEIVYKKLNKENYPNSAVVNQELTRLKENIDPDLYIEDEVALYAEYDGKHTFTFNTRRDVRTSNEIENIVLEYRPADGEYNGYYFKYDFTTVELAELDKLPAETILSKTQIVPLVSGNGGGLVNISCFDAVQNYVGKWRCEAGNEHEPGNPNCQVGGSTWVIEESTLSYVYVGCDDGGGSGSGGNGSGGSGGSTGGGGGGTGSGGGTGGSGGNGNGGNGSGGPQSGSDYSFVEGQTIVTQPVQLNPSILAEDLLNDIIGSGEWSFDNHGSEITIQIDSEDDLIDLINEIPTFESETLDDDSILNPDPDKPTKITKFTAEFKDIILFKLELTVKSKLKTPTQEYSIVSITPKIRPVEFATEFEIIAYEHSVANGIVTININGDMKYGLSVLGLDATVPETMNYQLKINIETGAASGIVTLQDNFFD